MRTGSKARSYSEAFQSAVEACRATTSQRAWASVEAISSPICSATTAPKGTFSLVVSGSGLCRRVTITAFDPDSSTYASRASRRSGANPSVLPV